MNTVSPLDPLFVISSDDLPSGDLFSGYFFDDIDMYLGQSGADQYRNRTGEMPYGKEGIYCVCRSDNGRVRVGTDYAGTIPLFVHRVEGFWAISPSFYKLMQLIKQRGDQVSIVPDIFQAWRMNGAIGQRIRNFQTCISSIEVLPSYCDLVGDHRSAQIVPRTRRPETSYEAELSEYKRQFSGRVRGIVESGQSLKMDLTGGVDSRSILAAAWTAFGPEEFRKKSKEGLIEIRSLILPDDTDYRIASSICAGLDVELKIANAKKVKDAAHPSKPSSQSNALSVDALDDAERDTVLERYRETTVGRWGVPHMVQSASPIQEFWISGVFGGNMKVAGDGDDSIENGLNRLKQCRAYFDSDAVFDLWIERTKADAEQVRQHTGGKNVPFWPLLHREFLMRMHSGQRLGSYRLYPLSWGTLTNATNFLDHQDLRAHKVQHDIIRSCSEFLFLHPYDDLNKNPNLQNHKNAVAAQSEPSVGTVSGSLPLAPELPALPKKKVNKRIFLQLLARQALTVMKNKTMQRQLGSAYCSRAPRTLKQIMTWEKSQFPFHELGYLHAPLLFEALAGIGLELDQGGPVRRTHARLSHIKRRGLARLARAIQFRR